MATPRVSVLTVLFVILTLTGCDFVADEETLVVEEEVDFRFEFSTEGDVGESVTVQSNATVDIDDVLFAEGYTRDDVAAASIRWVEINRIQPTGTNLDVFDSMELALTASGISPSVQASSDDLPADNSVRLDLQTTSVTQIVRQSAFGARLTVVPSVAEDYVLEAVVNLRIELEGI